MICHEIEMRLYLRLKMKVERFGGVWSDKEMELNHAEDYYHYRCFATPLGFSAEASV